MRELHQEGDGRVSNFIKRMNQLEKVAKEPEDKVKKGIAATGKTTQELKEQYIQDNVEQAEKTEEHKSLLNDFQL